MAMAYTTTGPVVVYAKATCGRGIYQTTGLFVPGLHVAIHIHRLLVCVVQG